MDFTHAVHAVTEASHTRTNPLLKHLDKTLTWGVRIMLLVLPLLFLPWTFELFEFNKQLFALGAGALLLAVWVIRSIIAREAKLVRSPLNWAALALLLAVIVSTVFSIDSITSILGFYGRFNGSLLSWFSYIVLYFLIMQSAVEERDIHWLVGSWLTGVGVSSLILILQLVGVRWLPFAAASGASFNPIGASLNAVVLLLAASLPLSLFLGRRAASAVGRTLSFVLACIILVVLFFIDYQLGWLGLLVGSTLWLALVFWKNEAVGFQWTLFPSLAFLLAVIAWPIATTSLTRLPIPAEVNLSLKASWNIARQNLVAYPLFGTGPETFIYGFSKYKPDNFNDSDFWAFRFDKAASEILQVAATTGLVGILAFVALLLTGFYLAWKAIHDRSHNTWYLNTALATSLVVFTLAMVFYFANTALAVGFWLVLALLARMTSKGYRHLSFSASPRTSFLFSFGSAVIVLVAVGILFGVGRFWMADIAYAKAQREGSQLSTLNLAQKHFTEAVNLNPFRDTYRIGLAQVELALANSVANSMAGTTEAEKQAQLQKLQSHISSSIAAARSATELAPRSVANWEAMGSIYRGTALFAPDAEKWVIDSYQRAIEREVKNPALYTELGKAYLISASRKRQAATTAEGSVKTKLEAEVASQTSKALEQFTEAIRIKQNYAPARFNIALAYEQQGKIDQAIQTLEDMRVANAQDIDVLYELGSLYYGKANYDSAEGAFAAITSLVPNHSNAHYGLSLVYQKKQDVKKAISQMQKVLELNPNNENIKKQLEALQKGEATNSIGGTVQPK